MKLNNPTKIQNLDGVQVNSNNHIKLVAIFSYQKQLQENPYRRDINKDKISMRKIREIREKLYNNYPNKQILCHYILRCKF